MDAKAPKDQAEARAAAQAQPDADAGTADPVEADAIAALVRLLKPVLPAVSEPILDYHAAWSRGGSEHREGGQPFLDVHESAWNLRGRFPTCNQGCSCNDVAGAEFARSAGLQPFTPPAVSPPTSWRWSA